MSISATDVQAGLGRVRARIEVAAHAAGRDPTAVALLAVSKTFGASAVLAAAAAGQREFGENYAQEGVAKMAQVREAAPALALRWHFIGPIQSNKTRLLAEHYDCVQSIDRLKVAQRLSEQRPAALPPLDVLVQVNISGETRKSGVAPTEGEALARAVAALPRLRLRGLMAIPEPANDSVRARPPFAQLRVLYERLRAAGLPLDTLSMGMSDDLEAAVAEGSTMVRVGTAIFGPRPAPRVPYEEQAQ
jgi:pyridoxal phosphate enzyme (YggS family)